jgi:light-regulated signal transduction histidine kinase (bacteriophytochrome)
VDKSSKNVLTEVSFEKILEDIRESLLPALNETQGKLEIGCMFDIQAQLTQMKYLMTQLIGNTFYYRKRNIPPVIKVWMEPSAKNQTCGIYVQDNGIGIDEKIVETVFWSSNIPNELPHRFGLLLCRKIVESHGGSITVKRFENEGSVFIVELPYHAYLT